MARSTVETCMFCAPDPCTCFQKPKVKPKPRVQPATPQPAAEPKVETRPASNEPQEIPSIAEPRRTAIANTTVAREAMEEDRLFRQALTILCESGIVSADSVAENADYLDMSPHEAKLLIWKLRRREWLDRLAKS